MLLKAGQHSEIALIQYRTAEPLDVASASALLLFRSTVLPHSRAGAVTARGGPDILRVCFLFRSSPD